jgi:DEAD/DEAH box helicase domain-containing protein
LEDIVDMLIDNNIPFSYDGLVELTNDDNEVIASASMIIDHPKIAIDPNTDSDKVVFEQHGYKVISQKEFNIELINKNI